MASLVGVKLSWVDTMLLTSPEDIMLFSILYYIETKDKIIKISMIV